MTDNNKNNLSTQFFLVTGRCKKPNQEQEEDFQYVTDMKGIIYGIDIFDNSHSNNTYKLIGIYPINIKEYFRRHNNDNGFLSKDRFAQHVRQLLNKRRS